jgi:hypothetical protein
MYGRLHAGAFVFASRQTRGHEAAQDGGLAGIVFLRVYGAAHGGQFIPAQGGEVADPDVRQRHPAGFDIEGAVFLVRGIAPARQDIRRVSAIVVGQLG